MNSETFDLKNLEPVLRKFLFETSSPEDGLVVIFQHPQLLTDLVDTLFDSLICHAHQQGNERLVKLFKGRHLLLQAARKTLLSSPQATYTPCSIDVKKMMAKLQSWLAASSLEEEVLVLQEHPELLSEQLEIFLHLMMTQQTHQPVISMLHIYKILFREIRRYLPEKESLSQGEIRQALNKAMTHLQTKIKKHTTLFIA